MKRLLGLALVTVLLGAVHASAASATIDFQDGTDDGFGSGFGNDASVNFNIVNIGGSLRMETPLGGFQVAGRGTGNIGDPMFIAQDAAVNDPSNYVLSYDWYVDTSQFTGSTFLQVGSYINAGGGAYLQDFGAVKEVELNGAQLASGGVFSGTFSNTFTAMYGALPVNAGAGGSGTFAGQTFLRLGLIENGNGTGVKVYFDNISIHPLAVPEPASLALAAIGIPALVFVARRRRK